jgi:type IV secretion system protein VirD4
MSNGLILGHTTGKASKLGGIMSLFDRSIPDKTACERFLQAFQRKPTAKHLVRLTNAVHTAVFAPTGVGKGVSCVIPFLLTCRESCFVLDVKDGELARITAEVRRRMGRKVYIIDPYHCVTNTPATLNPVQFIDNKSPYALDDCRQIAAEIVERKEEKGDGVHFLDNAEAGIAAVTATVAEYGEGDQKSLQAVCDIVSNPQRWEKAIELMTQSPAQEGMLARMGGNVMHWKDRELASTMSTIARFLRFLSTPAIAASTRSSSFDPREILDGNTDVYCVLPSDRVATLSSLLRVWTGTFLRTALRAKGKNRIHFVCDEAGSSLGKMDQLSTALTVGRSAMIRLQLYFQDLGQLKKCWPDGADQTLLANTTQVFFGVNDQQTAEYVSNRLGEETIVVADWGESQSWSDQPGGQGGRSTSYSRSRNLNHKQVGRKLLKPEEVAGLDPRVAITFTPGVPPIWTWLTRYYESDFGAPTGLSPMKMIHDTACVFLSAAALAAMWTAAIFYHVFR